MTTMQQAATRTPDREAFHERNGAFNKTHQWGRLHGPVAALLMARHQNFQRTLKTLGLITMVGVSANLCNANG